MVDFVLRQGDELPQIERVFTVDGVAIDLSGSTVVFTVYNQADVEVFSHSASVTDAVNGVVKYVWTAGDSSAMAPGLYKAMFVATYGSSTISSPNVGFITIQITSLAVGYATYTGDPASRPIDAVRFLVQDTDVSNPGLTDTEILWLIAQSGDDVYEAAAQSAEQRAASYASFRDKSVGPLSISYGDQSNRLLGVASTLRKRRGQITGFGPIMTQYSQQHLFEIGMHDYAYNRDLSGGPLNANQ